MKTRSRSQSTATAAAPTTSTLTVGIGLGDQKRSICARDAAGTVPEERAMTNRRESLRRLSAKDAGARMVMAVGSHSPWI